MVGRKHTKGIRGESGAVLASGSTQTRKMEKWAAVAWLSTKARRGVCICNAETIRDKYSSSRKYELANKARSEVGAHAHLTVAG